MAKKSPLSVVSALVLFIAYPFIVVNIGANRFMPYS
jgi:hypothetical protein